MSLVVQRRNQYSRRQSGSPPHQGGGGARAYLTEKLGEAAGVLVQVSRFRYLPGPRTPVLFLSPPICYRAAATRRTDTRCL
ncbi:hypothetical protein GCM10023185_41630 [Hymenobacter saemangeumensis]|uniref:Uncharacterized protein n=1 Tax=Hymenobacter saemangeumensis TaxID=1084522 RepID=A0ABP8IRE8_9BACT